MLVIPVDNLGVDACGFGRGCLGDRIGDGGSAKAATANKLTSARARIFLFMRPNIERKRNP
jgi:hypothetical protein